MGHTILIYTHFPHNIEKRLKLSLKKMLFFPQSPEKNSLMNIYIPSENVPCKSHNLLIFWLFCCLPLSNFGLQSYNLQKFHRKFCQRVGRDVPFLFRPSWGYAEILPKCLVLKFKIKKLQ